MSARRVFLRTDAMGLVAAVLVTVLCRGPVVVGDETSGRMVGGVATTAPADSGSPAAQVFHSVISRSKATKPSDTGIRVETGDGRFEFECSAQPLHQVVMEALSVSGIRMDFDPRIADVLVDVRHIQRPVRDIARERAMLTQRICALFRLELIRHRSKEDVWVLEAPGDELWKGEGRTLGEIGRSLEEAFDIFVDVEGDSEVRTRVTYTSKDGFEALREELNSTIGVKLTKQSRETFTWRLRIKDMKRIAREKQP